MNYLHPTLTCSQCSAILLSIPFIQAYNHSLPQQFCIQCFSQLYQFPASYKVKTAKLSFKNRQLTTQQIKLVYEGLQKFGYQNWDETAEYWNKKHQGLPIQQMTGSEICELIEQLQNISQKQQYPEQLKLISPLKNHQKTPKTVIPLCLQHIYKKIGYNPFRKQFQSNHNDNAQIKISELVFNQCDTEEETKIKYDILDRYNKQMKEREARMSFVLEFWLPGIENAALQREKIENHDQNIQSIKKQTNHSKTASNLQPLIRFHKDFPTYQANLEKINKINKLKNYQQILQKQKITPHSTIFIAPNQQPAPSEISYLQEKLCIEKKMDIRKYVKIRNELIESMNENKWSVQRVPRQVRKLSAHFEQIMKVCQLEGYVKASDNF